MAEVRVCMCLSPAGESTKTYRSVRACRNSNNNKKNESGRASDIHYITSHTHSTNSIAGRKIGLEKYSLFFFPYRFPFMYMFTDTNLTVSTFSVLFFLFLVIFFHIYARIRILYGIEKNKSTGGQEGVVWFSVYKINTNIPPTAVILWE